MSLLDDALAQKLDRRRLWSRNSAPSAPDGERRGSASGAGMEFTDHREYYAGDDLRHLDPHASARFGRPYLKRFAADLGLDVAVIVDATTSMVYGRPTKLRVAAQLAAALAYVAVSAGDRVRVAAFGSGQDVRWRPPLTSTRHVRALVDGLDRPLQDVGGELDMRDVARSSDAALPASGITIVISDWWTRDPAGAVSAFGRSGREVVAVQVVAPEEEDPALLGDGLARLVDAENGDSLDMALDADVRGTYARALSAWREQLRDATERARGRSFTVRTDRPVAEVVLDDWRKAGFLT